MISIQVLFILFLYLAWRFSPAISILYGNKGARTEVERNKQ